MSQTNHNTLKLIDEATQKLYDLSFDATNKCVQCGYCLPVCPTYESMGKETQSPRGRINLVKLASLGKIDILEHMADPIDLCLGCRACEVACPVGVPYERILESAKQVVAEKQASKEKGFHSKVKKIILNQIFPYPKRLRALGNTVWFYQKSGMYKLIRKTKVINSISKPLAALEKALPMLELPAKRVKAGTILPAKGVKKAQVAFFTGCVQDATMYRTNRLSIELLALVGCEVVTPEKQKCCGALHVHQGITEEAKSLAKDNIIAFEQSGADYYINNAGGCGAILREYDHLLADEPAWVNRVKAFVAKSRDISEILVQYGPLPFKQNLSGTITYQDSCHLRNVQGVYKEPRKLLQSIPGMNYVEMEDSDKCCASGGIYNVLHFNESMKILDKKIDKIEDTKAATVVTANPGCLLQIRAGIEQHDKVGEIDSVHIVDILAKACGIE